MLDPHSSLDEWDDNDAAEDWQLLFWSVFVTLFAGIMSGLTLGLMSLDTTQMEVLMRSGTASEKKNARKIMPLIRNAHHLLVTLLLGNAGAMTVLPLLLDRLVDPFMALVLSVTAVLLFGEIIPQAICSRYGLVIGAKLSRVVRLLMWVTSPISWTLGKVLDFVLGANHHSMFRRQQLKALVDIHGEATGFGGALSLDEIKVITGALDLTNKIAYRSMTPLKKVSMLSTDDRLDENTLRMILDWGHSRIPVHRAGDRSDIIGIVMVKELLQYSMSKDVPVAKLKMRSLPRLSAATPMYDMLKLFQTGRIHMAVLTQPEQDDDDTSSPEGQQNPPDKEQQVVEAMAVAAIRAAETEHEQAAAAAAARTASPTSTIAEASGLSVNRPQTPSHPYTSHAATAVARHTPRSHMPTLQHTDSTGTDAPHRTLTHDSIQHSHTGGSASGAAPDAAAGAGPGMSPLRHAGSSGAAHDAAGAAGDASHSSHHHTSHFPRQRSVSETSVIASDVASLAHVNIGDFRVEYEEDGGMEDGGVGGEGEGEITGEPSNPGQLDRDPDRPTYRSKRTRVPKLAAVGEPIGIITLEDVIEELIRSEIVDETDKYVDNVHNVRVEPHKLAAALPERLRQAVVAGNLPVDLMLKTKLGQRTVSRAPGLHVAINSLTQPLLAHAHDPSPGVAHMHATYTAPRL